MFNIAYSLDLRSMKIQWRFVKKEEMFFYFQWEYYDMHNMEKAISEIFQMRFYL